MPIVTLPPFVQSALLLDLDGTLLDIAPAPNLVVVPPELPSTLGSLRSQLGGALAVITGRPVEQIDLLLGDAPYAVAGEHGGAIRYAPNGDIERPELPTPPQEWLVAAEKLALGHPGALLEHKARGFVLHYRAAPDCGPALHEGLLKLLDDDTAFTILAAHMAWEVRPRGTDKGRAVAALMARAPFAGRVPVFLGDDVTDNDAVAMACSIGGVGFQVAESFGNPADVRAWLHAAAAAGDWPILPRAGSDG